MKVLFLPETLYTLIWRLQSAANGKTSIRSLSLMTRLNEEIFDRQLTIYDDPLDDRSLGPGDLMTKGWPAGDFHS